MKILIYTHEFPPFKGGLATSSIKLLRGLSANGFSVVALVPSYGPRDKDYDRLLPACIRRIPLLGTKWIRRLPFVQLFVGWVYFNLTVLREKPDAVIFITEEAEAVGGMSPVFRFKPVPRVAGSGITTIFLNPKLHKRPLRFALMRLYRKSPVIIAVSESTKELLKKVGVEEEKIRVVYNGVDNNFICLPKDPHLVESIRRRYKIERDEQVVLTVARVLPRKGQDMVIRALPRVVSEVGRVKYLMVGEGRYEHEFKSLAARLGVSQQVVFAGSVPHEDTIHYYDLADVFVMPNRFWNGKVEGLPNSVIEASARGLPVIVGKHGGSLEAVKDGVTGYLVDPTSPEDIAQAIIRVLKDQELGRRMGEKGREMVLDKFIEESMIKGYSLVIRSLIN